MLLPDELEHLDIDSSTEECGPIEERVWKDAHFWLALISAPIFSYFALTRFETFHLPSNRKSLIQQMRPTAVEVNSVYRSLGNGLWSIKDLSMSPWHCGFSSFDSYLLQLLDSLDPATKFHVKADPCWPFICYDIGDIGFGPITAATAGKMTILMRALSTPNYPQLIRIGMMMLKGDPKFI